MKTKFYALMGNVVMTIVAFIVKSISAKWAYRYTTYSNKYAERFLMGVKREVKLLNELAKNPDNLSEIKNHLWSFETKLDILQFTENKNLMKIFVEMMRSSQEWDAAMCNKELRTIAYKCKSYTPNENQLLQIVGKESSANLRMLICKHYSAFTPKVLEQMEDKSLFTSVAIEELNRILPEQVEFFLKMQHKSVSTENFIKKFCLSMPATAENAEILEKDFPELMKMWVDRQDANTLCNCCLERWAAHKNEQGLRIIEEKCAVNGSISAAEQLVKSTRAFYFNAALNFLMRNNRVYADLLYYVQEESVHYYRLVDKLLEFPVTLKRVTADQLTKFRDDQKQEYWLKLAESGNLTAEKLKEVPEELREKVIAILEENSMISWLQSHSPVNKHDVEFISNKAITSRVQCAMAKRRVDERWIYSIFSGRLFASFMRNRYRDDINFSNARKPEFLASEAFRILVDDNRRNVLEDYFRAIEAIPAADREYLLCSPLKDMALGVGTIS